MIARLSVPTARLGPIGSEDALGQGEQICHVRRYIDGDEGFDQDAGRIHLRHDSASHRVCPEPPVDRGRQPPRGGGDDFQQYVRRGIIPMMIGRGLLHGDMIDGRPCVVDDEAFAAFLKLGIERLVSKQQGGASRGRPGID
jgi:hypothetical protein